MCTEFENTVLSAKEIVKSFGGLDVLKHISINIKKGRVLALVGENGAGKSTLINILSGSLQADSGELYYEGKEIAWATPKKALQNGIAVVHQELTLFHNLPVYENVFAGNSATTRGMRLDRATMRAESGRLLEKLGVQLDLNTLVGELTMAQQQIVEIAKAAAWKPKLLILDEATSALDTVQVQKLFAFCRELLAEGTAIIFVSHRMPEIFEIADEVMVIKDGTTVGFYDQLEAVTENDLVNCMMGYTVETIYPEKNVNEMRPPILTTRGLSTKKYTMYLLRCGLVKSSDWADCGDTGRRSCCGHCLAWKVSPAERSPLTETHMKRRMCKKRFAPVLRMCRRTERPRAWF